MTGPDWAHRALAALCGRVADTERRVGERFPLHADPATGEWVSTARGSWTGGFWAGLLAVRAHIERPGTGAAGSVVPPVRARLARWVPADTVCRGMIFWYADPTRRPATTDPDPVTLASAGALVEAYDPTLGAIPWGGAWGPPEPSVRPDGAVGVVPLLCWASAQPGGPTGGIGVAAAHLATHLRLPRPSWSRGLAWLLLAAVDGARWLPDDRGGPEALDHAVSLAGDWLGRFGTELPLADPSRSDTVLDSSAAAVASVALPRLAALTGEPRWHGAGTALVRDIVRRAQLRSGPAAGGIGLGCYDLAGGTATAAELIWADFFTAIALGTLTGLLDPAP
jgi:unsaturated chondroitin disaccharide hydrolase